MGSTSIEPQALADVNRWTAALAKFARAELRKAKLLRGSVREAALPDKGLVGSRAVIFAYLSHLRGAAPLVSPKPEEVFDTIAELAAVFAVAAMLTAVLREVATIITPLFHQPRP